MHPRHLLHLPRCTLKGTPHGCIAKAKHCQPALRPKDLEWGRLKIKYDNNWQQHDWPYWAWIAARSVVQQCEVVHQFQLHWYCKIQLSTVQHWPCFPLPAYFPSQRLLQPQWFPAPLRAGPPSWGPKWLCLVVTQGLWWKKNKFDRTRPALLDAASSWNPKVPRTKNDRKETIKRYQKDLRAGGGGRKVV